MYLSLRDLAAAINVNYETVRKHVSRKKLVKSGKVIDTELAINREYILDQTDGKGLDISKIPKREKINNGTPGDLKPNLSMEPVDINSDSVESFDSISMRKKEVDLQKVMWDNELSKLKVEKMRGELLPTELTKNIMILNIQTIFREFESTAENIATFYCEILGGDRSHLASMVDEMRKQLKSSIDRAKEQSTTDIKNAIRDYMKIRGRGESK